MEVIRTLIIAITGFNYSKYKFNLMFTTTCRVTPGTPFQEWQPAHCFQQELCML